MPSTLQRLMQEATRLTRAGKLTDATQVIQHALHGGSAAPANEVIDVEAHEVAAAPELAAPEGTAPVPPSPSHTPEAFVTGRFGGAALLGRNYKLYIPPDAAHRPRGLVLMLHGCTQDPEDFAAGTHMNDAAREQGLFVLYPEQAQQANAQRCWNWFKHNHQQRGRGEAHILAGMVQDVMRTHAIDPARVYVAGLSAGGAMAANLGAVYADLFAAVGVHSGLAAGVANDVHSALEAMKRGPSRPAVQVSVPTIVFHGDADRTVNMVNGDIVVKAVAGAKSQTSQQEGTAGGRRFTRTVLSDDAGRARAEHWVVHGAGHAWSGGSARGSYADVHGPDATKEMLRFFGEHPKGS